MVVIKFYIFNKVSIAPLEKKINEFCKKENLKFSLIKLPKKIKKFTFLKAPHVNKKSKEHFALFTYKRRLTIQKISKKKLSVFLQQIPNNVAFKVTVIGTL